ncbi:transcription factor FapR [Bacillaceae bacterium]
MVVLIPRLPKKIRQKQLLEELQRYPFYTDEELASKYDVSVQTIRLDRMELGIPELRERIKQMAERNYGHLRSLSWSEVIGEVVDLTLDQSAISILEIREEHVFSKTKIARGHHIFAQANSLAVAVIDAEIALTAAARIRFIRPVRLGERLVAKAVVQSTRNRLSKVRVETRVKDELVFSANFRIYKVQEPEQEEFL